MAPSITLSFLCILLAACCHGEEESANHLLLFDSLPDGVSSQKAVPFDIRTNFSGSVQLVESRDFRIVVNITSPSLQKAYDVDADLSSLDGGVVLEIKEVKASPSVINLTWLFIGIIVATILVGIYTAVHAIRWYKQEKPLYEMSDRKSYASSSQRGGVYRSGNSMQMVHLPPAGDYIPRGDDMDNGRNIRCDEELRQVQELPEEEEAEALEMEQLSKLKLKEETEFSGENEDSDPQEKNLIKSRFHSQAKTIHKDLLKKGNNGKKVVSYKHTQNGTYEGIPTDQDETSNDEMETSLKEEKWSHETPRKAGFGSSDLQVKLDSENNVGNGKLNSFGKSSEKLSNVGNEPAYANDPSETDPMLLVLADVHKTTPAKTEMVSITKDKPGNHYVSPSELKPVNMSTFGPGLTSTPKLSSTIGSKKTLDPSEKSDTADEIFKNVAKKYQDDNPWFPQEFSTMGDIPEDPREDDQSVVSGSAKSASMYGSSEIFDVNDLSGNYYNLDSDFDVPPLDPDDVLSDGGLPSPLGFPRYRVGDKGKVNDDIKLIPGALKSPGPNTGRMVGVIKPRPYSSIILKSAQQSPDLKSGPKPPVNPSGNSPPLPPPPEMKTQPQSDTVFEFPPPPKFYAPPQHITRRQNQKDGTDDSNIGAIGDYEQLRQDPKSKKTEGQSTGTSKSGGGRGTPVSILNPTYMNLTILSTLCILSLATGVYSNMGKDETVVDVTVFAPSHFFTNTTRVFFRFDKDTDIIDAENTGILVYDVSQPLIVSNTDSERNCYNSSCDQGCDETNGNCICLKGYKLNNLGECVDVNECMEGKAKCDKAAGCYNRKGSYDCICGEDFYGNGKSCRECEQECPRKHYEVQPCTPENQKICKACTQTCRNGYFMAEPCTGQKNAICRVCQDKCSLGEFESRQCTNHHDRDCKNSSYLMPPEVSQNVILEEKRHIKDDSSELDKLPAHYVGFTRYKLDRGTGIYLELTVRFIDAAQQFLPVNSSQPYSLDMVAPAVLTSHSVKRYCPSPMPDYYILRYNKHEGITYKQIENGTIQACETHKQFGEFLPTMNGDSQSFICSQPGSLTNIFEMDENFFLARTKWVDKSRRCQRHSRACETCTRKCGTDMFSGDPKCSVAGDDNDNGVSPRLRMCYNCCVKRNCSSDCKDYHKRKCQPEQCSKGNLLEFTLEPSWDSSQDGRFFCHIEASPHQHLLELDYQVKSVASNTPLHSSTIMIYGDETWEKTGKMEHSDGILDITVDSSLGTPPNFLEGGTTLESSIFKVGSYKGHGAKFGASAVGPEFVFIRPPEPHGIPPMPNAHQECTHTALNDMLLASNMENPYIPNSRLEAIANYSVPFIVASKDHSPVVLAKLAKVTAVLKKLFAPTTLDASSFLGEVTQNDTHWVVSLAGEVAECPGFLHIEIHDPGYPVEALFDCDAAILCPSTFDMTFAIPMSDKPGLHKDIVVVIEDEANTHHFRIFRRSSLEMDEIEDLVEDGKQLSEPIPHAVRQNNGDRQGKDDLEIQETPELPLALPYLLAIGGTVTLLLVLAIIGLCFQPDLPAHDTPFAQWYHPLFAIGYMMFQFMYSIVVSGSVFFLILTVVTSHHVNFVLQHGQSGAVSTASSHIELLQLQRHLEAEISRQDSQGDAAQEQCVEDVRKLVTDMKKLHQDLLASTEDVFERHRLDLLLNQQKLHVRERLSKDLENFRKTYAKAARSVLRQVNQNALASYQNVQLNNTWLDGARFLHEAVTLFRKAHRKELKSFMEWTGIKAELSKLEIDLSFSLPALPRLDDIPVAPPEKPPIKRDAQGMMPEKEPIRSIQIHNNWFFPLEESGIGGASSYQATSNDDIEASKRETSIAFFAFLSLFILCDVILLAHRMCKAWTVAKLMLFGFPEYFRERKEHEMGEDDVFESKESKNKLAPVHGCKDSPMFQSIKIFFTQTISTTFFPKIAGAIAASVVLVCLLQLSNKYLTVKELGRIGLYHSTDKYLDLQTTMTNARLQTHADYINTVDFPAFQATMSGYVSRHKSILTMYKKHLTGLKTLSAEMYCQHMKAIGMTGNCTDPKEFSKDTKGDGWDSIASITHACKFQPVVARFFARTSDDQRPMSERQVEALLESLRYIIYHTSQLVVIFLTVIVLKELACAVLWILIRRSGVIRLRIIVEQDQEDTVQ